MTQPPARMKRERTEFITISAILPCLVSLLWREVQFGGAIATASSGLQLNGRWFKFATIAACLTPQGDRLQVRVELSHLPKEGAPRGGVPTPFL